MMKKRFSAIVAIVFAWTMCFCVNIAASAKCVIGTEGFKGVNPITGDNTPMIITIVIIILIAAGVGIGALVAINRRRWL